MKDNRNLTNVRKRRTDKLLILLTAFYFLGVVLGTVLYCTSDDRKVTILDNILNDFISDRLNDGFLMTIINSFSGSFVLLIVCFISGSCLIAGPLEIFIPLFKGMGAGTAIAVMYRLFGISGIGISAALIIPEAVFSAFVIIMASRESVRFSAALFDSVFLRNTEKERPDVKLYFTKFVILCAGLGISSLIDGILTLAYCGMGANLPVIR